MDDRGVEVDVFEAENGAVAVQLEETHAVLHNLRERTHCCTLSRFLLVGYGGNAECERGMDISRGKGRWVMVEKMWKVGGDCVNLLGHYLNVVAYACMAIGLSYYIEYGP